MRARVHPAPQTRPKPKEGAKQFSYVLNTKSKGDKYFLEYTVVS